MFHLGKGEYFGELSFITEKIRNFSAISRGFSSLYYITRIEFLAILKENPADYDKFCYFKDEIQYNDNYQLSELKCLACNIKGHSIENCKKIHVEINKALICSKLSFSIPIKDRTLFKRRNEKFKSKLKFKKVLERLDSFIRMNSLIFNIENSSNSSEAEFEENEEKNDSNSNHEVNIDHSKNKNSIEIKKSEFSKILSMNSKKFEDESISILENTTNKLIFDEKKDRSPQNLYSFTNFLQFNSESPKNEILSPEIRKSLNKDQKTIRKIKSIIEPSKDPSAKFDTNYKKEIPNLLSFKTFNKKLEGSILERNHLEFDKMKNFEFYYPQHNIENMIKKFNEVMQREKKGKKKRMAQLNLLRTEKQ